MHIRVMSWNMAGAKLLGELDSPPNPVAASYIKAYREVWEDREGIQRLFAFPAEFPDIILLQECIGFIDKSTQPSGRWLSGKAILQRIFQGYECFFFPALSSHHNPHPAKWKRFEQGQSVDNYIPNYVEVQQGYGICIRNSNALRKIWIEVESYDEYQPNLDAPGENFHLCFEAVNTTTGLYLGSRDTEPRLVIMGRMKIRDTRDEERYVNFLNLHLATLRGERTGNIRLNRLASDFRLTQLDQILNHVISAYQETTTYRVPRRTDEREEDIWIVGGDLNATEDSEELSLLQRMGFVDGNEDKRIVDANPGSPFHNQIGTKWSLSHPKLPPIVVDYILCGLERTTFPRKKINIANSQRPFRPGFRNKTFETDHTVLFASFEI